MNVTVALSDLRKALTTAGKLHAPRLLPILGGVRLEASDGLLRVTATNLDMTWTTELAAVTYEAGTVVVGAKSLAALCKGKGQVNLADDGTVCHVVNGVESVLPLLPPEEWPAGPEVAWGDAVAVDLAAVGEVAMAASRDNDRPILTGVLFRGSEVVATDSYRLRLARGAVEWAGPEVLVPAVAFGLAARSGKTATMSAGSSVGTEYVRLVVGTDVLIVRTSDGDFPNYRLLIPTDQPYAVTVERERFVSVLGGVAAVVAKTAQPVRFEVVGSELVVSAQDGEGKTSRGTVPCKGDALPPFTFALNPDFLADALSSLRGEHVTLRLTDPLRPVLLSEERDGGEALRLLMPVRVA